MVVEIDDPGVGDLLDAMFEGLRGSGSGGPPTVIRLHRRPGGMWVSVPGGAATLIEAQVLPVVVSTLNQLAVDHGRGLLVHAAAVHLDGAALVAPGPSGVGKSTLACRLVTQGFRYLSDEVTAIDLRTGTITPFQKPITLKPGARSVLPDAAKLPAMRSWRSGELRGFVAEGSFVPAQWLHPGALIPGGAAPRLTAIVCLDRHSGPTTLTPISRAHGAQALLTSSFNFIDHGGRWLPEVARCLEGVACHRLLLGQDSDPDEVLASLARSVLR